MVCQGCRKGSPSGCQGQQPCCLPCQLGQMRAAPYKLTKYSRNACTMRVKVRPNRPPIDYLTPFSDSRKVPSNRMTCLNSVSPLCLSQCHSQLVLHSHTMPAIACYALFFCHHCFTQCPCCSSTQWEV